MNRRKFIKNATGFGVSLGVGSQLNASKDQYKIGKSNAKNCIFMVVDGMGRGTLSLANDYHMHISGRQLNWLNIMDNRGVYTSLQNTASYSSLVTDSAAAGSAWASGERVPNGHINVTKDGKYLNPFFLKAKALGKSIGIVTTARITHATPASFLARAKNRNDEELIANQYFENKIDVLMGGGAKYFNGTKDSLLDKFRNIGYTYIDNVNDMISEKDSSKILGLFSESHLPYALDRNQSKRFKKIPSLEDMFRVALSNLSKNEIGFCLQVEAARVDHAGHAKDTSAIIHEQLEFDRCIPIALEFVNQNPETLLIISTDHGTGGCQLNGIGEKYYGVNKSMEKISKIKASYELLAEKLYDNNSIKDLFSSLMNLELREIDISMIKSMIEQNYRIFPHGYREKNKKEYEGYSYNYLAANLGAYFERYFYEEAGVGWTSDSHTSELVDLIAYGACSETLPKYIKNYELNRLICNALDI